MTQQVDSVAQMSFQRQKFVVFLQKLAVQNLNLKDLDLDGLRAKGLALLRSGLTVVSALQHLAPQWQGVGGGLLSMTIAIALLLWNWPLVLATTIGILVMLLIYAVPAWDWQTPWLRLCKLWQSIDQRLVLAVLGGTVTTFGIYLMVAIGSAVTSSWLALGFLLEGLGILAILGILIWQGMQQQTHRQAAHLDRLLDSLTDDNALRRLVAVRQMTQWVTARQIAEADRSHFTDYLRLLLHRESEPVVRDAALEGLQALNDTLPLPLLSKNLLSKNYVTQPYDE